MGTPDCQGQQFCHNDVVVEHHPSLQLVINHVCDNGTVLFKNKINTEINLVQDQILIRVQIFDEPMCNFDKPALDI